MRCFDRERGDFGGAGVLCAQIPFGDGGFGGIDGLNDEIGEGGFGCGQRRGGEEAGELRDHRFGGKVARPDA